MWIGLTGGIASGKSSVARELRRQGYPVIDADELARRVVVPGSPALDEIKTAFGPDFLANDQSLDRKRLGDWVFSRAEELRKLENILHPRVRDLMLAERARLESSGHRIAFYDVPLLFEKNLENDFDAVVAVVCSQAEQLKRLMARDSLTSEQAQARIQSQLPLAEKARRAQFVIDNSQPPSALMSSVALFLQKLLPASV